MKKVMLILALSIMSLAVSAQEVLVNTTNSEGQRRVSTREQLMRNGFTDTHPYFVSLSAMQLVNGSWTYTVMFRFNELTSKAFPEGGVILAKTATGEVLEFKNILSEKDSRDWVGELEGSMHVYHNRLAFFVDREQLEKMFLGVIKLRVQTSTNYYDIEYKKDRLGIALSKHVESIDAAIAENKDIRDDF